MKSPQPVTFDHFRAGLYTNRSPLAVPSSNPGTVYAVQHPDALIDGSNVEISPRDTIVRRGGWPANGFPIFGSSEWPTSFWSGYLPNAAGTSTLVPLIATQSNIYYEGSPFSSIYTKGTTAQTFFQKVGNLLYFSDGTNNMVWPGTGAPTNNGTPAPVTAPVIPNVNLYDTVGATQTFHAWIPSYSYTNSTSATQNYFLMDPNGNIQWSVIGKGSTNISQATVPNWAAANGQFGTVTTDGGMAWTNCGQVGAWIAGTAFTNSAYATTHQTSSICTVTTSLFTDLGGGSLSAAQISATAVGWNNGSGLTGNSTTVTITNLGLVVPTAATIQGIQVTLPRASNRANAWKDVVVQLLKAGSGTGTNKALTSGFWPQTIYAFYTVPQTGGTPTVYGSNSDLWGTTWTPAQVIASNFGIQLQVHNNATLVSDAAYTLPITIAVYYMLGSGDITGTVYAQIVKDSNGNLQAVKTAGTSSGSTPSWSTTIGGTTTDGATLVWQCLGTANQLPALFSWTYGYSFHTLSPHTSTLSPLLTVYAPMIGNNVPLQGFGSADTQVDRNDLYRTPDGGSLLLFDQSTPNVNATTAWNITDNTLDLSLNLLIVGPIAHLNDPPPAGMTLIARYQGRMWGAVGNLLYFSAGPDCTNGNGDQAWPPANVFVMTSNIVGLEPTSQGLVVGLQDEVWAIVGGPQTLSFYPQQILQNFGVLSPNCMIADGDTLYMYTSSSQLFQLSAAGKEEIGFPVADVLAVNFNPTTAYLAVHRAGSDEGLFISNQANNVMRYSIAKSIWCPLATVSVGIGAIGSLQTSPGTHQLIAGTGVGSGSPLARNVAGVYDGPNTSTTYTAFATIGPIILSAMGSSSPAAIKSFVVASGILGGTAPTLSVLPNEVSGAFTSIPVSNQDPYQLPASSTVSRQEFQWLGVQTPLPNAMRHLQVKLSFIAEAEPGEIYSLAFVPIPTEA